MQPDDEAVAVAPEAEAFKLGLFALVRLKAFEPMAAAVLANGQPVTAWWPVAYALQRVEDPRAVPALLQLLTTSNPCTRAFAARGLGPLKDTSAIKPLLTALIDPAAKAGLEPTVAAIRSLAQRGAAAERGSVASGRRRDDPSQRQAGSRRGPRDASIRRGVGDRFGTS